MSKNKTRLIVVIAAIVTIISTFCYAEAGTNQVNNTNVETQDAVTTSYENDTNVTDTTGGTEDHNHDSQVPEDNPYSNESVHDGDLYVFDSDVVMDKLVDGNVFIFGNNVTITGQASGNMFVFGNNVTFDKAYVQASVFVCGNKVKFNAVSSSLYCAAKDLTIDKQFGVYTDIYATCSNFNFDGIIGRNAFLAINSMKLGENAIFYKDLNYSSKSEIEIPEGLVQGEVNYNKVAEKSAPSIGSYISNLVQLLVFAIVTYFIVKLFTKAPTSKDCSVISHPFKTFGIGLLSIITIPVVFFLLLISIFGATTSLYVLSAYLMLLGLSTVMFSISLARYLCIGKKLRGLKEVLLTSLITVITWGLSLVPFIGWIFSAIVIVFGFGTMIYTPLYKIQLLQKIKKKKLK